MPIFDDMAKKERDLERNLQVLDRPKAKKPRLYEVLLHNDDYTTQEFVVFVLMKFFHHPADKARQIMLHVHTKGVGVAGVYTRDIAETKAQKTVQFANQHEMPLQCSIRPAPSDGDDGSDPGPN